MLGDGSGKKLRICHENNQQESPNYVISQDYESAMKKTVKHEENLLMTVAYEPINILYSKANVPRHSAETILQ